MTTDQLNTALNNQVSLLNESVQKLSNYLEDWTSLPSSVKTRVKTTVNTSIDEAITQLSSLKSDINAL